MTIIGGRNVGDEYFGAHEEFSFIDLDVLAIGGVVASVARDFERYWTSKSAVPVKRVIPAATASSLGALRAAATEIMHGPAARAYSDGLRASQWVRRLLAGTLPFIWTRVRLLSDPPSKGLGLVGRPKLLTRRLGRSVICFGLRMMAIRRGWRLPVAGGTEPPPPPPPAASS